MDIVEINDEVLSKLPRIFDIVHNVYKTKEITVYAFADKEISGFICSDGIVGLYIDKYIYKLFKTDSDFNFLSYMCKNYVVEYGDKVCFKNFDGLEFSLDFIKVDKEDNNGYDGKIIYTVYYPDDKKDLFCQFTYLCRYVESNNGPRIYPFDFDKYESVYIEEGYSKSKFEHGLIPKRIMAFNKVSFNYDMIGYDLVKINEKGVLSLLNNSDLEEKVTRFVKSYYLGKDGIYRDFGLFGRLYKKEEIDKKIEDYGIPRYIDRELIALYNKEDYCIHRIQMLLDLLKMDEKKNLGMSMTLREN